MVKIVDNYVLERVIGKGQFGEVYKGYHKVTSEDVAIKAVNRKNLKGKFYELLENEIKVLRSCNNVNIIKLYDIKKTQNNIYLMLEYCNEGDLMQYLKKRGKLTEDEAVDIFIQILNGFKTLIKNKILHRDFKLANILRHNGIIKIADFGFAKILNDDAFASTMLGSPLNMAPEILGSKDYNSKADIWSIGTCFYEILFGKPPYTAKNIVELLKKIESNPFQLPPGAKVSAPVEDVLKKMLIFNPDQRISWDDLFNHKVTKIAEEKIMLDLEETMKNQDISNISRFYIKNNKVIDNVVDIEKRKDINDFAYEVSKNKTPQNFTGNYVNRQVQRESEEKENEVFQKHGQTPEVDGKIGEDETEREKSIRIFKLNSSKILHERNKYVFLASVAEDAISLGFKNSDLVGYLLIKKLFKMLSELKTALEIQKNLFSLEMWGEYVKTKEYKKIWNYILKEYDLFKTYYENLNENVRKKFFGTDSKNLIIEKLIKASSEEDIKIVLRKLLKDYVEAIFMGVNSETNKKKKEIWSHINQLLDCLNSDKIFTFETNATKQFNFKLFYEEVNLMEIDELQQMVRNKLKAENIVVQFHQI